MKPFVERTEEMFRNLMKASGPIIVAVAALGFAASAQAFIKIPKIPNPGNGGASNYQIYDTESGICRNTKQWPGGEVGLMRLRSQYQMPRYLVDYGHC